MVSSLSRRECDASLCLFSFVSFVLQSCPVQMLDQTEPLLKASPAHQGVGQNARLIYHGSRD